MAVSCTLLTFCSLRTAIHNKSDHEAGMLHVYRAQGLVAVAVCLIGAAQSVATMSLAAVLTWTASLNVGWLLVPSWLVTSGLLSKKS